MTCSDEMVGLPPGINSATTQTKNYFAALENFQRTFAFKQGDKVLLLTDPLLDTRVADAIMGLARARGATVRQYMETTSQVTAVPEVAKALISDADFVVSTWFCSILDPFFIERRIAGQRWVKITYFRDLDRLVTPQARFPIDLVGEILRATERLIPKGEDFELRFSDQRGSDLRIPYTKAMRDTMFAGNRWRGKMCADEAGCYVHYLPTHGPNFWDTSVVKTELDARINIEGVLYPQWAIGFAAPFAERIAVVFKHNLVTEVRGESLDAHTLRDMLMGSRIIEGGGCGFNPKAPRYTVYPAGSNSPGALHFGVDLARPSDYIRRVMPNWEEPPVHQDLIVFDATVTAGRSTVIDKGFLMALRDPEVVAMASRYGDPLELLESFV